MNARSLDHIIPSLATSDGAGVKLRRSLGRGAGTRLDPFLMLDEFFSDDPGDYIAGFPSHPHRGFETVTYMLDGQMLHEDHLGNRGELKGGGAQWMTAGRGIIHSEMPQQDSGRMRGFQLWINLPAREKMKPAGYRDLQPDDLPIVALVNGGTVKVIAGTLQSADRRVVGPIQGLSTDPLFFDVHLPAGAVFSQPLNPEYAAFVYPYDGDLVVLSDKGTQTVESRQAGALSPGDLLTVQAGAAEEARFLLLSARPLGEPIVQYGPFVMNSREEVEQAAQDYQAGTLVG